MAANGPVQAAYLGLANRIQVNPAVAADPSLVQQGTVAALPGAPAKGASDQTVINAVLNFTLGTSQTDLTTLQNTLTADLQSNASALTPVSADIQAVTQARASVTAAGATLAADISAAAPFPGVLASVQTVATARAAATAAQAQVYTDQINGVNPADNGDQTALTNAAAAVASAQATMLARATTANATTPGTLGAAQAIINDWTAIDAANAGSVVPAMTQLASDVTAASVAGNSTVTSAAGTIVGDWNAIDAAQAASASVIPPQTQGLGLSGTLSAPFAAPQTLSRFRRRRGLGADQRQQRCRCQPVHRAGGADDPEQQRRRRFGRVGRYGDVHHDRAAERLRRQCAHHHRDPGHVDLAARHRHQRMRRRA